MTKPTTFLGIDPAFRKNGFALCARDRSEKTVQMHQFRFAGDFFAWLWSDDAPDPDLNDVVVCIENSDKDPEVFQFETDQQGRAYVRTKEGRRYLKPREVAAIGQRVGKNQAISAEVVRACMRRYPGRVIELSPREKGAKINHAYFLSILRSEGETLLSEVHPGEAGQDKRDAYKLAILCQQQRAVRGIR